MTSTKYRCPRFIELREEYDRIAATERKDADYHAGDKHGELKKSLVFTAQRAKAMKLNYHLQRCKMCG